MGGNSQKDKRLFATVLRLLKVSIISPNKNELNGLPIHEV